MAQERWWSWYALSRWWCSCYAHDWCNHNTGVLHKQQLTDLLKEYKDCFAWDYIEMPSLDRSIVEHRLPIKSGFRPHQQPARWYNPNVFLDIKAEITQLIEAKFIRQCRYAEWISNVVPVYKKNGKLRVCIDFRNLKKLHRWMATQCQLPIC